MEFFETAFVVSAHRLDQLPQDNLPEIVFAGRSNVGKSSLLNTLLNRKQLVKVSSRPGKTTGLNYFLVENKVYFVDLPGYGYAKVGKDLRSQWGKLITSYLQTRSQIACVVVIVDLRHGVKQLDSELLGWLRQRGVPFLSVFPTYPATAPGYLQGSDYTGAVAPDKNQHTVCHSGIHFNKRIVSAVKHLAMSGGIKGKYPPILGGEE